MEVIEPVVGIPDQLMLPDAYTPSARTVELAETHISWVFLADEYVYKVKKPLCFPFLNYGTLDARRHACEEEVRLNRRLAPQTYLGILPIVRGPEGRLHVGGSGQTVEHCVQMRRLPLDQCLDKKLMRGEVRTRDVERLLDVTLPFYRSSPASVSAARFATPEAVLHNLRDNFEVLGESWVAHSPGIANIAFPRIATSQLLYVHAHRELFSQRIADGHVSDGHGDLRPEHVCMLDPPVVFDCVEFSESLRIGDVVSELAFLAMELERLGHPSLATSLLDGYRRRSNDDFPATLASFYKAYRACVRAKVDVLRARQVSEEHRAPLWNEVERYLQLASYHANEFHRPILAATVGASGTGKSTVANTLSRELAFVHLRTDELRAKLAGGRAPEEGYGQGQYAPEMTEKTYDALFREASGLLANSASIVLDGTFREKKFRQRARTLARQMGAEILFLRCECPPEIAEQRIAKRIEAASDLSDARPDFHRRQITELMDLDDLDDTSTLVLDTSQSMQEVLNRIVRRVRLMVSL